MSAQSTRFVLNRRRLLRGAFGGASVAIGLPCLDMMLNGPGDAYADGAPIPKRFGLWFFGAGANWEWTPPTTGPLVLQPGMTSLQRHLSSITLVSNLNCAEFGDYATNRHAMGCSSVLAGCPPPPTGDMRPGGATIDQLVAKSLGSTTPRTSLEVSVFLREAISFSDANTPNPPTQDPRKLFQSLFGAMVASVPVGSPGPDKNALRGSYLDAVQADIADLKPKLGKADSVRLDSYLNGLQELEKQVSAMASTPATSLCVAPTDAASGITDDTIRNANDTLVAINQANSQILAAALACGMTQVFTVNFSTFNSNPWLRTTPPVATNHHELGHQHHPDLPRSVEFIMARLAELLDALGSHTEGPNNLLYNTGILVQTEVARNHEMNNMPTLLAGNAGGALKSGLHVAANGFTTRASYTLAKACGASMTSFGVQDAKTSEIITDVMA